MVSDFQIARTSTGGSGTFGVFMFENTPLAVSLEDPWNDNKPYKSCIPAGTYLCERVVSPMHGSTFEVMNVQGRTHILFHKGNTHHNTEGCILLGEEFGVLTGEPAILHSGKAFAEFQRLTTRLESFVLAIRDYWTW